ncbi:MAG: FliH/SctL family protein [Anaerolineales bacterium]
MPSLHNKEESTRVVNVQNWQPIDFQSENALTNGQKEKELYQATIDLDNQFTEIIDLIKGKTTIETPPTQKEAVLSSEKNNYQTWQPTELEPLMGVVGIHNGSVSTHYAKSQAEAILHDAKQKAEEILHQAELEALHIRERAQCEAEETYQNARQKGLAAANAETQSMLLTAKSILEEVQAWKEAMFEQGEMMMLRLVIEIAQTMFGDGLPLDPDTLGQTFSRALNQAKTLGNLRIFVHPEDAAVLATHWNKLQGAIGGQQVELIPSEVIKRGGCYIDGQFGSVDARVETQFETIKESLLTSLEKSKAGVMA